MASLCNNLSSTFLKDLEHFEHKFNVRPRLFGNPAPVASVETIDDNNNSMSEEVIKHPKYLDILWYINIHLLKFVYILYICNVDSVVLILLVVIIIRDSIISNINNK